MALQVLQNNSLTPRCDPCAPCLFGPQLSSLNPQLRLTPHSPRCTRIHGVLRASVVELEPLSRPTQFRTPTLNPPSAILSCRSSERRRKHWRRRIDSPAAVAPTQSHLIRPSNFQAMGC